MSPEERDKARRGLRRFEHMSPEQREQARALFGQMRDMPPAQREALRERWSQMTPEQRKDWVRDNPPPAKPRASSPAVRLPNRSRAGPRARTARRS
ncbi:hypothetical protein G6F59_015983 [Rhizopus arrhizus]|nr:hypothetical protein G6F59_015983 [Rhizopus arrhizus]